jgi:large subunit ribosomal protein L23
MGFFDKILKRKEERKKRDQRISGETGDAASTETRAKAAPAAASLKSTSAKKQIKSERGLGVLRAMHVTEKANMFADQRKYEFIVADSANKHAVRDAVAGRYGVRVLQVSVRNMPKKMRRRGRHIGFRSGFKKAIVTVGAGDVIEVES